MDICRCADAGNLKKLRLESWIFFRKAIRISSILDVLLKTRPITLLLEFRARSNPLRVTFTLNASTYRVWQADFTSGLPIGPVDAESD